VAGGLVFGIAMRLHMPPIAGAAIAAIVLVGVSVAQLPRWRRLDHMQQDSRLLSWFWGGSIGSGFGLLLALLLGGPERPLVAGAALVWLLQFAGYAVARLWWWLAYRAHDA
jgi:hypothetical protein